ncbi:mucin-binding protein [uncultured Limosilactobacillus sp.]|uniref:mucin-binding protein n=1 Tax=uncultured Limosilactobacillus sp. TaxID=2837629 RepID=UPI0025F082F0|nr:YSIRK-type signal peptide-containing protein [uncultured Limosilactobacillus sp.]
MLSKNNLRLLSERNTPHQQHFSLRKLTIGVASVLLGTTFMVGAAYASTDFQTNQTTSVLKTTTSSHAPETDQLINNGPATQATNSQQTTLRPTTSPNVTSQVTDDQQADEVATPTFSGMTNWKPNNATKQWTGKATDAQYRVGDQSQINYIIQSYGGTDVANSQDFQGTTKYLIMIPAGFNTTGLTPNRTDAALGYQLQDLGMVGPNGERSFMLTLAQTPSYRQPLQIAATITPMATAGGAYNDLYSQWSPLLMPLAEYLHADGDNGTGGGMGTITLKNGTTYHYVRDLTSFNNVQWYDKNSQPAYTIIPGAQALANNNYKIISVKAAKADATQIGQAGYEEITPKIQITGTVQNGDYLDFHLGIPYRDGQTGTTKYILYDHNLAKQFSVANIGTVYNMGDYYRLVFDNQAGTLNNPTFTLNLRWGAENQQASINSSDYVYRSTTDPLQDHTQFDYMPTDDVTINGQTMASGLIAHGQYIYTAQPIGVGINSLGVGNTYSTNRTWNQQGDVSVNTHWDNVQTAGLAIKELGNEFDISTTVTKDPTGQVNFTFTSAQDLARAIEKAVASNNQQSLTNSVVSDGHTYVTMTSQKGERPRIKATVTLTVTADQHNPNQKTAVWHVQLANLDPTRNPRIIFANSVPLVTATANNFTMPDGITSYDQDQAAAKSIATDTYQGAKTSNTALMKVLQSLPVALTKFVTYQNGQPAKTSSTFGGPWNAAISYNGNNAVEGGGSAADLVTNTLHFEDLDSGQSVADDVTYQGATGSNVHFSDGQAIYNNLSNYHFVKAVSVQNGRETVLQNFDPTKLASFSFGTAGKSQPHEFIIYVQKNQPVQQTAHVTEIINYRFEDETPAAPQYTKTVTYKRTGNGEWQADGSFKVIPSPQIDGYTPNLTQVDVPNIAQTDLHNGGQLKEEYDVVYQVNKQTAKISYVDDTLGGITLNTDTTEGNYGSKIQFFVDPAQKIKNYEKQHYILVSNNFTTNAQYQADNQNNVFVVHLKHATDKRTKLVTITRTIKYLAGDHSVAPQVIQTVTFTGTALHDQVADTTGDYQWQVTDGSRNFAAVSSPVPTGYQIINVQSDLHGQLAGQNVQAMTTAPTMADEVITVRYAQQQSASLNFIDDETGVPIHPVITVQGRDGQPINFGNVQSIVDQLTAKSYVLKGITDDTPAKSIMTVLMNNRSIADSATTNWQSRFGNFGQGARSFTIHFTHGHGQLTEQHQRTVTETIHYQTQAGHSLADPLIQTLTFNGVGYRDLVTGQDIVTGWQIANGHADHGNFGSVKNPVINGYHVVSAVDEQGTNVWNAVTNQVKTQGQINHTSPDVKIIVTYAADVQPTAPKQPTHHDEPGTVQQPTLPKQPVVHHQTETPAKQQSVPVMTIVQGQSTVDDSEKSVVDRPTIKRVAKQLPQTGTNQQEAMLGLGIISLMATLGLAKRKHSAND